jgi:hypothetical protein
MPSVSGTDRGRSILAVFLGPERHAPNIVAVQPWLGWNGRCRRPEPGDPDTLERNGRTPIDEVITQLEQAVLEATKQAVDAIKSGSYGEAGEWASLAHKLAEALVSIKGAYNPR